MIGGHVCIFLNATIESKPGDPSQQASPAQQSSEMGDSKISMENTILLSQDQPDERKMETEISLQAGGIVTGVMRGFPMVRGSSKDRSLSADTSSLIEVGSLGSRSRTNSKDRPRDADGLLRVDEKGKMNRKEKSSSSLDDKLSEKTKENMLASDNALQPPHSKSADKISSIEESSTDDFGGVLTGSPSQRDPFHRINKSENESENFFYEPLSTSVINDVRLKVLTCPLGVDTVLSFDEQDMKY